LGIATVLSVSVMAGFCEFIVYCSNKTLHGKNFQLSSWYWKLLRFSDDGTADSAGATKGNCAAL
jgi:hypothetical protein